ncbi:hypothetical protein J2Y63_006934 [Shinella sp. BE166]|uniref:hypothetical protein n=1 Tax=Shinella sp. BE166 TaxID=3373918 RepID=UPI003EBD6B8C
MSTGKAVEGVKSEFGRATAKGKRARSSKAARSFTFRLSDEERASLSREAGKLSLAAHIRRTLLGEAVSPRRGGKPSRRQRSPAVNQIEVAKVLAMLGRSELSRRLDELAVAAVMGALPVGPELVQELHAVCAHIRAMRAALMDALNIQRGFEDDTGR